MDKQYDLTAYLLEIHFIKWVKDFPIKPTFSQDRGGKRRVFTPQKQEEDGRATEGYLSNARARFFRWLNATSVIGKNGKKGE